MNPRTIDRGRLFWILQTAGWASFGLGMLVAGLTHWAPAYTAVHKSSLMVFGFAVSLLLRLAYRTLARTRLSLPWRAAAALPLSYLAACAWMPFHHLAVALWVARATGAPRSTAWLGFPDTANAIYYAFLLLAWSALWFGVNAWLDLVEQREQRLEAELLARRAQLRALRLQLDPHFLFNALNGVSTLVAESRGAEANRMLARLAEYLRFTLDRVEVDEVPLEEEIDFTRRYLAIESVRLGDRLRVLLQVGPGVEGARVPPLLLQPLVENALRHAVAPRLGGGRIAIAARAADGWLTLAVDDDGEGVADPAALARGVGLTNTEHRLAAHYGGRATLALGRGTLGGLGVSIRLPLVAAESTAATVPA